MWKLLELWDHWNNRRLLLHKGTWFNSASETSTMLYVVAILFVCVRIAWQLGLTE